MIRRREELFDELAVLFSRSDDIVVFADPPAPVAAQCRQSLRIVGEAGKSLSEAHVGVEAAVDQHPAIVRQRLLYGAGAQCENRSPHREGLEKCNEAVMRLVDRFLP